ncbi:acetylornithine aminotransferase [Taxawa tesnikishii (nom. ined.)]|nr:acetylornithine aminotransferase [Dothideales sp. JES 119]
MSFQAATRRIGASVGVPRRLVVRSTRRNYATPAAGSNLPKALQEAIQKEASLPNADPPSDSQTARLVNSQTPYMVPTYVRPPPMFQQGEGCYLFDVENRQYLDFTAGIAVNALGHCDPEMSKLIAQQAQTLLLVEKTRESGAMKDAGKAFICNSGSEANEAAIKFARKCGKTTDESGAKHEIVSFHNSFHGRTMGSLSATPNPKYQKPFGPMVPGFRYGTYNDIDALKDLVTEKTCGVIVEPIQGEGGVNVATDEFLVALRRRCNEVGAVLIYDEIQCGLSRTGTLWAHGSLPKEAHPDILTTAKALGNGFPIGATIVTDEVSSKIVTGDHGTTFGGNPLGSRLAHYIVSRLSQPALQESVLEKEKVFRRHFERLQQQLPDVVKEIRGRGLILGMQLSQDPTPVVTAAREGDCSLSPVAEIEKGMAILEEAMTAVFKSHEHVEGTDGQQEMRASRAPAVPEISHEDASVSSLIDVDSPHISSVPSDYESQEVKTDTQAERERLEQEAQEKAEQAKEQAKKQAGIKKEQAKEKASKAADKAKKNSDNPVVLGNAVTLAALGGLLGFGAYRKYTAGELTWKVAGAWAGVVGLFAMGDYYVSQYFFQRYPPKK